MTESTNDDCYAILQVDTTADIASISASYRKLARLKHPDKNRHNPDATAEFQKLQQAYSILSDNIKRAEYDRQHQPLGPQARPVQTKCSWSKFYAFHINTNWANASPMSPHGMSGTSQYSYEPIARTPSPPKPDPLEEEIRTMRQQIRADDAKIKELKKKQKQMSRDLAAAWQNIHEHNDALHQISEEFQLSPELLDSGNKTPKPNLAQFHEEAEKLTAQSRTIVQEMHDVTMHRGDKEAALRVLCAQWHANEFEGGDQDATTSWDGWGGWCGWDAETDYQQEEPEEADCDEASTIIDEEDLLEESKASEAWWNHYDEQQQHQGHCDESVDTEKVVCGESLSDDDLLIPIYEGDEKEDVECEAYDNYTCEYSCPKDEFTDHSTWKSPWHEW